MVFCNFLEIKAETKKVVGVKFVSFGVFYSCVEFRRLKMGDPVYINRFQEYASSSRSCPRSNQGTIF